MKKYTFTAAVLATALCLTMTGPAKAVDPARGSQPQQNQTTPTSNNYGNLGNNSDPFFNSDLFNYSTTPRPSTNSPVVPVSTTPGNQRIDVTPSSTDLLFNPLFNPPTNGQPPSTDIPKWRLGVISRDMETGVKIEESVTGGAARRAGLESGDILIAVNGQQVGYINGRLSDCATVFDRLADRNGWVTLLVQNSRNGQLINVPVQLDPRIAKLSGSIALPNGRQVPNNATVNVELREVRSGNSQGVAVASTQIDRIRSYPIPFEMEYDPANLSINGQYLLFASIRENGRETYRTADPVRISQPIPARPVAMALDPVRPSYESRPLIQDRESTIAALVGWFQQYLGRAPSDRELAAWLEYTRNGYPLMKVQRDLLANNQFFNRCNQDKSTYIQRVHELLVGQKPTDNEYAYWSGRYDALNGNRVEIAREFQEAVGIY